MSGGPGSFRPGSPDDGTERLDHRWRMVRALV